MQKKLREEQLIRFFRGECSQDEAYEVIQWISSDAGNKEFEQAFAEFNSMDKVDDPLKSEMYNNALKRIKLETIAKKLDQENDLVQLVPSVNKPRRSAFQLWKIAAIIALIIGSVFSIYIWADINALDQMVVEDHQLVTKRTEAGQKLTVHLSDGSVAVLNANSSITYQETFSDSIRKVKMSGEVFFDVAKNPSKPFIVQTTQLVTTALGTSFNVRAYKAQDHQVSLVTGKVRIDALQNKEIEYLEPGEEITYNGKRLVKTEFNTETKVLWKDGILYFKSTPLERCFTILENWYDVEIEVIGVDRTKGRLISGRFDNDYLVNVLNSLSYAQNFEFTMDQKRVTIKYEE